MEKIPLLFYPIEDDIYVDVTYEKPSKLPFVAPMKFTKVVIVDSIDQDATVKEICQGLQLSTDDVARLRVLQDTHRGLQRALIYYHTLDGAKAAVTKFHRNPRYGSPCAMLLEDLLLNISGMEKVVWVVCDIKGQDQIVDVCTFIKQPGTTLDFLGHLTRLCTRISCDFSIHLRTGKEDEEEMALVKFSCLHDAFAAEMAFDMEPIDGRKLGFAGLRNPTLVQHDLKVRPGLMWKEDEECVAQKTYFWTSNLPELPKGGCSNIGCTGCGNAKIKIKNCLLPSSSESAEGRANSPECCDMTCDEYNNA